MGRRESGQMQRREMNEHFLWSTDKRAGYNTMAATAIVHRSSHTLGALNEHAHSSSAGGMVISSTSPLGNTEKACHIEFRVRLMVSTQKRPCLSRSQMDMHAVYRTRITCSVLLCVLALQQSPHLSCPCTVWSWLPGSSCTA